jgi:hypothetical protein
VWIAVLCSVKLFPNLEAALKGVFNRGLNNFPNASGTLRRTPLWLRTFPSDLQKASHLGGHFADQVETGDVLRAAAKPGLAIEL